MELIVISDNKLKIMLSGEDLKQYSLDCSMLNYENTETRKAFWSILDEAKHRTGFDAASEKVFVQVYPSRSGGCEMYVTKLGMFSGKNNITSAKAGDEGDIKINEGTYGGDKSMKKSPYIETAENKSLHIQKTRAHAFRFETMENLLSACHRLLKSKYDGNSSAYIDDKHCYLLLSDIDDWNFGKYLKQDAFVNEYAEELEASSFIIYIGEYGKCICEHHAIEILGALKVN